MEINNLNFDPVYKKNRWGNEGNGSGPGSSLKYTRPLRKFLKEFILKNDINSITDTSVGGMLWWPDVLIEFPHIKFNGYDISNFIIRKNQNQFRNRPNWNFKVANAISYRFDSCDLVVSRHSMEHLSIENGLLLVENLKKTDARFIGFSTSNTITENKSNENRKPLLPDTPGCFVYNDLNLSIAPFNLNKPLYLIKEHQHCEFGIWKN